MYTTVYAKVRKNDYAHDKVMFDIVKQGCPSSPTLVGLYIDELETHLNEIDRDYLCLFNIMVAILLYADDVALLSKSRIKLQRLLSTLYEFCTSI